MATTIFDTSFDAGLDGWDLGEGAALDGVGGITFAAATAPNSYIYRTVEYTGSEAYITFRITFSASATDNFYLSVWADGGAAIAAFIGGEVAICGDEAVSQLFVSASPSLPAGATPVTLLAGQNDASLVFTSGGAMLFLNGVQVTPLLPGLTTSSFADAGPDTGTLTIPSSFVIDSATLFATDTPPAGGGDPPSQPVSPGGSLPPGLDTSWEAAQELAGSGGAGSETEVYALLRRDVFDGAAGELSGRTFPTQVGASGVGAAWTSGLSTPPRLDGSGALEVSDAAYFDDDGGYGAPTAGATIPQPATGTPIRVSAQVHVPPSAAASYVWGARFKVVEPALLSNPAYRHTRISVHIKNMTASDAIKVSRVVQYSEVGYVDEVSFSASVGGSGDRLERISLGGTSLKLLANGVEQDLVLPWALPADSDGLVDVSAFFFSEGWAYTGVPTRLRMFELAVTDGTFASEFWTNFVNSVEEV